MRRATLQDPQRRGVGRMVLMDDHNKFEASKIRHKGVKAEMIDRVGHVICS
jgi:hypothetical protein